MKKPCAQTPKGLDRYALALSLIVEAGKQRLGLRLAAFTSSRFQ